jgi:hypothetical protein
MPEVKREYIENEPFESPAFETLKKYVLERGCRSVLGRESFEEYERELHRLMSACEAELVAQDLARHDVEAKYITVEGIRYRRAIRAEQTYVGQAGPIRVERNLYQPVGGGPSVCPLELQAGMVEGTWTPRAARIMATVVAELPPGEAEGIIAEFGGMTPSASSLDRIPKLLSQRWEGERIESEDELRTQDKVPKDAAIIATSLDGVHVPLKKKEVQDDPKNKNGYREASCGTVSYLDKNGKRLSTIRFGRMPERKKRTLKSQLQAEFDWAMAQRPDLLVVKIADGAPDNWEFLQELGDGPGVEILDFYHAAAHIKKAADAVYGAETPHAKALFESWRTTLKEDPDGADKLIRAVRYRRDQVRGAAKKTLTAALKYFRTMKGGMEYFYYITIGEMRTCIDLDENISSSGKRMADKLHSRRGRLQDSWEGSGETERWQIEKSRSPSGWNVSSVPGCLLLRSSANTMFRLASHNSIATERRLRRAVWRGSSMGEVEVITVTLIPRRKAFSLATSRRIRK